jgi:sodium-independent sulfate anion transporter 11
MAAVSNDTQPSPILGLNIRIDEEDEVSVRGLCVWCGERFFTREKLRRRIPISQWLPSYSLLDARGDVIAGLSVAFTLIPQALALATLAGLPAMYGLYSSFMGCFLYALFGTCSAAAIGPTSILAIIVAPYVMIGGAAYAILLAFFSGLLMLLLGLLNLGFIVDFISYPVISAFSCSAAITIAASQLKGFFGLHFAAHGIVKTLIAVTHNIAMINWWDFSMGLTCLIFLIPLQAGKEKKFEVENTVTSQIVNGSWWVLVTGRNAIVVIVTSSIAYFFSSHTNFTLTSEIRLGLPDFQIPVFQLHSMDNETVILKDFPSVLSDISVGVIVLALIELMETVAVAKAFLPSQKLDSTQEMIALGLSNLLGSFVSSFPVSGSFSRSAVNYSSGVRTPLGGIITGSLVLLALATLAPFFELIPQTALSSIIIAAVIPMIKFSDFIVIMKSNKLDLVPYVFTFVSCLLLGLEFGIAIGVNISLGILLYQMARPRISMVERMSPEGNRFIYLKPDRSVFFPSIEYLKVKLNKFMEDMDPNSNCNVVVIDGEHMFRSDSTFGVSVKNLVLGLKGRGVTVMFYNLRKPVHRSLRGNSLREQAIFCRSEMEVYAHMEQIYGSSRSVSSAGQASCSHHSTPTLLHPQNHPREPLLQTQTVHREWMSRSMSADC